MLRASHYGNVKILIPMLCSAAEVDQTLQLIEQAKRSLDDEGIAYDPNIPVGGMMEIPAAALALGLLTKHLDFLSIGTNDLIQYTLAIDRTDDTVAHLYDPLHPAVLKLLAHIIQHRRQGADPGLGVRRNGRRRGADAPAAGAGPAPVLDAFGAPAGRQAARIQNEPGRCPTHRAGKC